jgi:Flp pilus assembly protein TadG
MGEALQHSARGLAGRTVSPAGPGIGQRPDGGRNRLPRLAGRRRGSALVEFALTAPVLLLLLAGVLDFSMLLRTASSVADAARAGAQYGSASMANASDTTGIRAAATGAAPGITGMTTTAARSCQCWGGGTVDCGGSCGGGMIVYVAVTSQATAPTVMNYGPLPYSGLVSFTARMRAQ